MSSNNRIGRNPFDKKPKASSQAAQSPEITLATKTSQTKKAAKTKKSAKTSETAQAELVLKTSDKKIESAKKLEAIQIPEVTVQPDAEAAKTQEQIIGELIDLSEENWQPLTAVPSQFIKQLLSRWI